MKLKYNIFPLVLSACIMFFSLHINVLKAEDFHVTTAKELKNALYEAKDNGEADIIYLAAGTYNAMSKFSHFGGEDYALTIKGEAGTTANEVILDGSGEYKVLSITKQGNSSVTIEGITVQNGVGGIDIRSGDIILTNNIITKNILENEYSKGGGVYAIISEGNITLTNNTITGNEAHYDGGGVYAIISEGNITLTGNTIKENKSFHYGGGSYHTSSGNITVTNNIIIENKAGHFHGGIGIGTSSGNITLANNTVTGNEAGVGAGGLQIASPLGSITLTNNIITNNVIVDYVKSNMDSYGGGINIINSNNITLTNNTITGNKAFRGGGISFSSQEGGGAIVNIYNNIIWGNEGVVGADIYYFLGFFPSTHVYNNSIHSTNILLAEYVKNIDEDPLFANQEQGDYHLLAESPCIDKGTVDAPELPSTDFEGDSRILGSAPDIGADEHNPSSLTTTTLSPTSSTTTISSQPCPSEGIYGENSEKVDILRYYRDKVLRQSPEGQELIRLYYQWSSVIVKAMEGDEEFKEEVKEMIDGVLLLIREEVE